MKKKNQKLVLQKEKISNLLSAKITGGAIRGHESCNPTCARSCNLSGACCPSRFNNCQVDANGSKIG